MEKKTLHEVGAFAQLGTFPAGTFFCQFGEMGAERHVLPAHKNGQRTWTRTRGVRLQATNQQLDHPCGFIFMATS